MKTNNKNSARKKLIPAAGSLLISAVMLSTSTYAWFTMNKTVTVTGMTMSTTVGSNLLISNDNTEGNFKTAIEQNVSGVLEPVSTVNGINYFYTVQASADGKKLATQATYEDLAEPGSSDTAFHSAYGNDDALGYIDYTFYLKATSTADDGEKVSMTKCNLYRDASTSSGTKTEVTDKAWRVAMFVEKVGTNTASCGAGGVADAENLKSVLGLTGADYFTDNKGVKQAAAGDTQLDTVIGWNTAANLDSAVAKGNTQYYKVIVRLWLEGEDESCTNATYAPLDSVPYHLDLRFDLVAPSDTHAVSAITSDITWDPTAAQAPLS